jgi:predicted porin
MFIPLNKLGLALVALGAALANGQALAQAAAVPAPAPAPAFTWYGTLAIAAENSDDGSFIRNTSQSIGSKLGIKGETEINKSLKAMFQIETGVAQDDSANSKAFANRNSFVGLDSPSFGRVLLGTYDMPFKDLKGNNAKFDGNDDVVEIVVNGKGLKNSATANLFTDNVHTRQLNVVHYASPKFSNMQAKVAYGLDEPASNANTVVKKPVYGASFEYNDGTFNAGLAFETKENVNCTVATCLQNTVNGNLNARKVTLGWQGSAVGLGLVFGTLDNGLSGTFARTSNTAALTGTYKMGDYTYRAGYGMASESLTGLGDDFNMLSLEVAYALHKSVNVFGYYSQINNNAGSKARFEGGENKYSPALGGDPRVLGVGINYSF